MRNGSVSAARRRRQARKRSLNFNKRRTKADLSWMLSLFRIVVEIALVIGLAYSCVWFFGVAVEAVGNSMSPGIVEEDMVLLNRLDYIFRNPKVGDVVAFRVGGRDEASVSIKRIVAVPGDSVYISGGRVFVNDEMVEESESIPVIMDPGLAENEVELSDNEYFVLGDNRNHSTDSRFASVGNINKDYFLGRVWFNTKRERFGLVE